MTTAERCLKCDGSPLRTGECDSRACTKIFLNLLISPSAQHERCCWCGTNVVHHACTGEEEHAVACKKLGECDLTHCTGYVAGSLAVAFPSLKKEITDTRAQMKT